MIWYSMNSIADRNKIKFAKFLSENDKLRHNTRSSNDSWENPIMLQIQLKAYEYFFLMVMIVYRLKFQ